MQTSANLLTVFTVWCLSDCVSDRAFQRRCFHRSDCRLNTCMTSWNLSNAPWYVRRTGTITTRPIYATYSIQPDCELTFNAKGVSKSRTDIEFPKLRARSAHTFKPKYDGTNLTCPRSASTQLFSRSVTNWKDGGYGCLMCDLDAVERCFVARVSWSSSSLARFMLSHTRTIIQISEHDDRLNAVTANQTNNWINKPSNKQRNKWTIKQTNVIHVDRSHARARPQSAAYTRAAYMYESHKT